MSESTRKNLENHLAVSERSRFVLKLRAAETEAGEDSFLWGLADLMTILLIFFILLYSTANHSAVPKKTEIAKNEGLFIKNKLEPENKEIPISEIKPVVTTIQPPDTIRRETNLPLPETDFYPKNASTGRLIEDKPGSVWDQVKFGFIEDSISADFYIRWDEQRPTFVLGERITFKIGRAELLENFQVILRQLADLIASIPTYQVVVTGHTDNTPISTNQFPSNWELSVARAVGVTKFLILNGVAASRITIQGHAEYMPLYDNSTTENRKANRRVEITLIKGSDKK